MLRGLLVLAFAALLHGGDAVAQERFELTPGDVINITVLEDPSLNTTALIRPDGRFSLPIAGTIEAGGRTPEEVQAAIRRALTGSFIEPPTVTVALQRLSEQPEDPDAITFYVIGAVGRPGQYNVVGPIDVLQALAIAGGTGAFAANKRIQVRRRVDGRPQVLLVDFEQLEDGSPMIDDLILQDGDVILAPQRRLLE